MAMPMMDERVQKFGAMREAKAAPAPMAEAPPDNTAVIEEVKALLSQAMELLSSVGGKG